MREGSSGAELISALVKVSLSMTWLTGQANATSSVFQLFGNVFPSVWVVLGIGLVHLAAWTQPPTLPMKGARKACCIVGQFIWGAVILDLWNGAVWGTVILIVPFVVFLTVAIFRHDYGPPYGA